MDLDRSTLADWVGKSTALLEPLADPIGRHVLSAEAIFADDTPVRMLAPGTGRTQTARLWTYARDERPWGGSAPPAAWYRFSGDRKGAASQGPSRRFRGWMHADGYIPPEGGMSSGLEFARGIEAGWPKPPAGSVHKSPIRHSRMRQLRDCDLAAREYPVRTSPERLQTIARG